MYLVRIIRHVSNKIVTEKEKIKMQRSEFFLFSLLECSSSVPPAFKLLGVCTFPEIGSCNPPVHSQPVPDSNPTSKLRFVFLTHKLPIWISKI